MGLGRPAPYIRTHVLEYFSLCIIWHERDEVSHPLRALGEGTGSGRIRTSLGTRSSTEEVSVPVFFFCFPRGFELISMWIHARKHSRLVGSGPKGFKKQRTAVEEVDSRRNFEGMFGTHVGIHQTVIKVFRNLFLFFICFLLLR